MLREGAVRPLHGTTGPSLFPLLLNQCFQFFDRTVTSRTLARACATSLLRPLSGRMKAMRYTPIYANKRKSMQINANIIKYQFAISKLSKNICIDLRSFAFIRTARCVLYRYAHRHNPSLTRLRLNAPCSARLAVASATFKEIAANWESRRSSARCFGNTS